MAKKSPPHSNSPLYWSAETWAFMSLRLFLGLRFLAAGLGKFKGEDGLAFANYYQRTIPYFFQTYEGLLPAPLTALFAYTIAYLEIALALLLLAGAKTKFTLAGFALTFVMLGFGLMLLGPDASPKVTDIGIHLLLTAAALYFVRHNKWEALR